MIKSVDMLNASALFIEMRLQRELTYQRRVPFGIPFLDDAIGAISPTDLIVVGAATGLGKTEFCVTLCDEASKKVQVTFFALEAEMYEVQQRLLYRKFADIVLKKPNLNTHISYRDFRLGVFETKFESEISQAQGAVANTIGFRTIYRTGAYGVRDFCKNLMALKEESGLMVVDHLHYFDTTNPNELNHIKESIKLIRDTALIAGIPIVLVSHLRKKDKFHYEFPTLDELHGSSEISKRATIIILIEKAVKFQISKDKQISSTIMHIAKLRHEGGVQRYYGLLKFNLRKRVYENEYYLLEKDKDGFKAIDRKENLPWWANRARVFEPNPERF
jgi:replicative DNA helicase